MQFIEDNKILNFEDFSMRFPGEWSILADYFESDWKFKVVGTQIYFVYGDYRPVSIDINAIMHAHKVYFFKNSIYKEPLARAIGLKKGKRRPTLLDATAGFLGDALLMSSFDIPGISCCERHPVAACLAYNAINNSDTELNFHFKSALEIKSRFDVCFYDPMYSEKNTKTAPKKEMKIFREVIGEDNDCEEIASHLFELANERLVIKRSNKANFLIPQPHHSITGKSTRYDIYLK